MEAKQEIDNLQNRGEINIDCSLFLYINLNMKCKCDEIFLNFR